MSGVSFTKHATDRMAQRNIWIDQAIDLLEKAVRIYPPDKDHKGTMQYWKNKSYIFVISVLGNQNKVITLYKAQGYTFIK